MNAVVANDSSNPVVIRIDGWHTVVAPAHSYGFALSETIGTIRPTRLTVMDEECRSLAEHILGADYLLITIAADNTVAFNNIVTFDQMPSSAQPDELPMLAETSLCS